MEILESPPINPKMDQTGGKILVNSDKWLKTFFAKRYLYPSSAGDPLMRLTPLTHSLQNEHL